MSDSQPNSEQQIEQNNAAMELINSVTGLDEEARSRQRVLAFAARMYAYALERNPEDCDALYNLALVLQESADNVSPESRSPSKDALLEEACKKYEDATRLCPTLNNFTGNYCITTCRNRGVRLHRQWQSCCGWILDCLHAEAVSCHKDLKTKENCTRTEFAENLSPPPPVIQAAPMTWEQPYATGEVRAMILDGDTSFVVGFIGHGDTGKMLGWKQVEVPLEVPSSLDHVEAEAHAL